MLGTGSVGKVSPFRSPAAPCQQCRLLLWSRSPPWRPCPQLWSELRLRSPGGSASSWPGYPRPTPKTSRSPARRRRPASSPGESMFRQPGKRCSATSRPAAVPGHSTATGETAGQGSPVRLSPGAFPPGTMSWQEPPLLSRNRTSAELHPAIGVKGLPILSPGQERTWNSLARTKGVILTVPCSSWWGIWE